MYLCFSCVSLINRSTPLFSPQSTCGRSHLPPSQPPPLSHLAFLNTHTYTLTIKCCQEQDVGTQMNRKWTHFGASVVSRSSEYWGTMLWNRKKERVCYKYSIYHIMFNELILKGTVHPNITKHWKIWNTPHEFYGLFLWWFYVVLLSFFGLDSLLPLLLNGTYVNYYFYEFLDSHWRHPFTADNLLVSK